MDRQHLSPPGALRRAASCSSCGSETGDTDWLSSSTQTSAAGDGTQEEDFTAGCSKATHDEASSAAVEASPTEAAAGSSQAAASRTDTGEGEVRELRARLCAATKLLADREEALEALTAELSAFKSLYKEAILGNMTRSHLGTSDRASAASSSPVACADASPRRQPQSTAQPTEQAPAKRGAGQGAVSSLGMDEPPLRAQSQAGGGAFGRSGQVASGGARLGRFYSWRDMTKRAGAGVTLLPNTCGR